MIAHKHISKIIIAITAVAVVLCLVAPVFAADLTELLGGTGVNMEYEYKLFDTSEIIEINIVMDEDDWEKMLTNALSEEYYTCDVVINGTRFKSVAIRPKGNTSLSNIAMDPDTDRYSLKLEFDHFVDGQTCFGLDKLILNNGYADATYMKEAIVYDMYQYLDVDASLYNYAKVSVNGEYWGVYLALEAVEQSFMLRNYGTQDGELYKPEVFDFAEESSDVKVTEGGADLDYIDDDLDSYVNIWDTEITSTNKADHQRVVTALKNISEGNDLETYMDVDNLLKYMAVHTFAANMDSLSGSMFHNYYLYEYEGRLNILPWDYNLSWGGMALGETGTNTINFAVDSPFPLTDFFDGFLENEEYLERYHGYLQQLSDEYIKGGRFDETYTRIRSQIDELVAEDPTAFYTAGEYEAAADMLYTVLNLRADSIDGQLSGDIPSTSYYQSIYRSKLIDGSDIDISVLGQMDFGEIAFDENGVVLPPPSDEKSGELPADFDPNNMPEGFSPDNMPAQGGGFPSGSDSDPGMTGQISVPTSLSGVITLAACFVIALVSLIVVTVIKPKS